MVNEHGCMALIALVHDDKTEADEEFTPTCLAVAFL